MENLIVANKWLKSDTNYQMSVILARIHCWHLVLSPGWHRIISFQRRGRWHDPKVIVNQKGHYQKNGTCTSETNLYPYTSHSVARCVGPIQSSRGVGLHGHINFPILSVSDLSQRSMPVIMHNMLWCTKTRGHDQWWIHHEQHISQWLCSNWD